MIDPTVTDDPLFSVPPGAVVPFAKVPFNKEYSVLLITAYEVFHLTVSLVEFMADSFW